jgi:TonB family protein
MSRLRAISFVALLVFVLGTKHCIAAHSQLPPPAITEYPNSADGLKNLFQDILDAAKSHDTKRETELIHSLILPKDTAWFKEVFGPDLGEQASLDYQDIKSPLESDLRRVLEGDIREGSVDLRVKTITDPKSVNQPIVNILHDMQPLQPLYEVGLTGHDQQSFEIHFSQQGKGFQTSGDPDGYFFYINGGFRFVPTNALVRLPDGRPEPGHKEPPRPLLVHSEMLRMPDAARRAHVSGTVRVHLVVDAKGKVINVTVKDGDPLLVGAAKDSVRKWQFKAPIVDGKPIQSEIDAELSFQNY